MDQTMSLSVNPDVIRAIDPPIAEAQSWIAGKNSPPENPLLDMAQAVPSYPPAKTLRDHLANRLPKFETAQYSPIAGIVPLRSALSEHMNQAYGGMI